MGLKKYEIITVGSDKRVRALRSWQVGDRYVNIGDVGGIVYDEKTLSQDGACWLFRGNFNFPGARIGGDSIVDIGEEVPDVNSPTPDLSILGSSAVVGSKVRFSVTATAADAIKLIASDFEQGGISYSTGTHWETWKAPSANIIRTKTPIFMGGKSVTLNVNVPGYTVQAFVMDRDGIGITATTAVNTGAGITVAVPAGQYFMVRLLKNPVAAIVPADATAAQIKFTGAYKNTLNIIDSRVSINPATDTVNRVSVILGGNYPYTIGGEFPPCNIVGSTFNITRDAGTSRSVYIVADVYNSNALADATTSNVIMLGVFSNVKNSVHSLPGGPTTVARKNSIQAYDCDNMVVSLTNFPGLAAAQTANVPVKFYGCNLNAARIYHHARIANTYRDINFDLATRDLGKTFSTDRILGSSEVNGMYRVTLNGTPGPLVESYESVKSMVVNQNQNMYDTTIYADAYFKGFFDIRGTNVFGNTMKHEANNTQNVTVVQGGFILTAGSPPVPSTDNSMLRTVEPVRINGSKGLSVQGIPAGVKGRIIYLDVAGNYKAIGDWYTGNNVAVPDIQLVNSYAHLIFRKPGGEAITPDEVKGVTVTTYNGCKLVNTKATAAVIAGNVRVEDNAIIIDTSVTGTGYFGGNSIIQAPSTLVGQLPIEGAAYMSDNAVFAPTAANASAGLSLLEMKDNAVFAGQLAGASTNYNITMANNAQFLGIHNSRSGFVMRGNSFVAAAGAVASACRGLLIMKDDARIESNNITAIGYITLCGLYKQTADKVWTGKRVIDDQNAPIYDNNVKTKYDI